MYNIILNNGRKSDTLIVFTDSHTATQYITGDIIRYFLDNTIIDKVFFLGDIISAYGNKSDIAIQLQNFLKTYEDKLGGLSKLYKVKGNHDLTITDANDEITAYTLSQQAARNFILGRNINEVTSDDNIESCSYFFDNKSRKIRYIFLDTTDNNVEGNTYPEYKIDVQQLEFIAKALKNTPSNYSIIIVSHVGLNDGVTIAQYDYDEMKSLIRTYNERGSITVNENIYNYADADSIIRICLSGHEHQDLQNYENGILYIGFASEAPYKDYKFSPFFDWRNLPTRESGTIYESLFDILNIDFDKLYVSAIRIGAAFERYFNLECIEMSVGEQKELTPKLNEISSWESYDNSGHKFISTGIGQGYWEMSNNNVSVDNGLVTANQIGEAIVFAQDNEQNKEFFYIKIK